MRNLTQRYMPVPAAPCTMQSACFLLLLVLHILRKLLASPVALLPRSPGNRLILCSHSSDIAAPPPLPPSRRRCKVLHGISRKLLLVCRAVGTHEGVAQHVVMHHCRLPAGGVQVQESCCAVCHFQVWRQREADYHSDQVDGFGCKQQCATAV